MEAPGNQNCATRRRSARRRQQTGSEETAEDSSPVILGTYSVSEPEEAAEVVVKLEEVDLGGGQEKAVWELEKAVRKVKAERVEHNIRIQNLLVENERLKEENVRIGDLKLQVSSLERVAEKRVNEMGELREKLSSANKTMDKLKKTAQEKTKKILSLGKELGMKEKALSASKKRIQNLEESLRAKDKRFEEYKIRQENFREMDTERELELRQQLTSAKTAADQWKKAGLEKNKKINSLRQKLKGEQEALIASQERIQILEEDVQEKVMQIEKLQQGNINQMGHAEGFLGLPVKLIENNILSCLEWNDLLKLRGVCKQARSLVRGYVKQKPEIVPEIQISGDKNDWRTLDRFFDMGMPCTRVYFNGATDDKFFKENALVIDTFLRKYGKVLTHVRLPVLRLSTLERKFWNRLTNLNSVTTEAFHPQSQVVPDVFRKLRYLKIGKMQFMNSLSSAQIKCLAGFIGCCYSLEHFDLPKIPTIWNEGGKIFFDSWLLMQLFSFLDSRIQLEKIKGESVLRSIDFKHLENFAGKRGTSAKETEKAFLHLSTTCGSSDVKMFNVSALWFLRAEELAIDQDVNLGHSVVSLQISTEDSSNIQKLRQLCQWTALEKLTISVSTASSFKDLEFISQYFLEYDPFKQLTELVLSFPPDWNKARFVTRPLVRVCCCVKKMTLRNWKGSEKELVTLCNGLPGLEQVFLEVSSEQKNAMNAFVLSSFGNPVLLNIAKLRQLYLEGSDIFGHFSNLSLIALGDLLRNTLVSMSTPRKSAPETLITHLGLKNLLGKRLQEFRQESLLKTWCLSANEEFRMFATMLRFATLHGLRST